MRRLNCTHSALGSTGLTYSGTNAAGNSKWTGTNLGASASCRSTTAQASSEHVFKFTLANAKYLQLKLNAGYDSVLSLLGPDTATTSPPAVGANLSNGNTCNRTSGADDTFAGNFAAGTYYVVVHGYTTADKGTYTLTVSPFSTASAAALTSGQLASLDYAPNVPSAYLGTIDTTAVTYKGTTSGSTVSKWTTAQLSTASCRTSGQDTAKEHLFQFAVTGSAKTLTLKTVGIRVNASFDSTLSLFGTGGSSTAPAANLTVAAPNTCNRGAGAGADDVLSVALASGTYYVLVHGYTNSDKGNYTLTLTPTVTITPGSGQDTTLDQGIAARARIPVGTRIRPMMTLTRTVSLTIWIPTTMAITWPRRMRWTSHRTRTSTH